MIDMINDKFRNLKISEKVLYICFGVIFFLVLLFGLFRVNKFLLFLLSIEANLFLIFIFRYIIKKNNFKFDSFQKKLIFIMIGLIYLFYFFSIINRKFIYYWDYSTYYNLQMFTRNSFSEGLFVGIRKFIMSTWSGKYGNFISFFPEFIFNFTSKTINSYVLSCVVVFIPYLVMSLLLLLKAVVRRFEIKRENTFIGITLIVFLFLPVLHTTFIYGQPDLFGLVFIFLIISLSIDYEFEVIEKDRALLLIILTFMLVICRRWYLYFILVYYICYFIRIIILCCKDRTKLKRVFINWFLFVGIAFIFFFVTLLPLIKNIFISNFGSSYAFYMAGGFKTELVNQLGHLGYIPLLFILIGIVYGFVKKKYRLLTLLSLISYILMIYLFTRIQNMGLHHSLILLPVYLVFICCFVDYELSKSMKFSFWLFVLLVVFGINFGYGYLLENNKKVFTDVPLRVVDQDNYREIGEVASWLRNNLNKNNTAYMIPHNNNYNPDKFRNYYMPDMTIADNMPYGSAILGVHEFPTELFTARYVLTSNPFLKTSVEEKYNFVFNQLVAMKKFKLIKDFDMKDENHILIYERIKDFDREEAELYLNSLEEESKMYPNLYKDVIDEFIKEN